MKKLMSGISRYLGSCTERLNEGPDKACADPLERELLMLTLQMNEPKKGLGHDIYNITRTIEDAGILEHLRQPSWTNYTGTTNRLTIFFTKPHWNWTHPVQLLEPNQCTQLKPCS